MMKQEVCPQCGGNLVGITYPNDSPLNRYQWEAVVAGDFYCPACPDNERGKSGYCYWWKHELPEVVEYSI